MSSDTEPTSGIFVNNQSTLNVKGNLSGTNTYLSTENSKVNVNKDLKLDGKTETIFGSFNGSDIKVMEMHQYPILSVLLQIEIHLLR